MVDRVKQTVEITDIGPIQRADIPVIPGRVTVLTGPNGIGKSTAIKTVQAVATGKNPGVTARDGRPAGTVRIPGVTIRVGAKISKRGEAETPFAIIEDGQGLSRLIDPGVKSPEAADRKRLEALLEATGTECDTEALRAFLGDDLYESYRRQAPKLKSFVDAAADVRRYLHEKARASEDSVAECEGVISRITPVIGELPKPRDLTSMRAELSTAEVTFRTEKAKAEQAELARVEIDRIGDSLPNLEDLRTHKDELEDSVARLREELDQEENRLRETDAEIRAAEQFWESYGSLRENVSSGPDPSALSQLEDRCALIQQEIEEAAITNARLEQIEKERETLVSVKSQREQCEADAARFRDLATQVPGLFRAAVSRFPGWSIDDDLRLCVDCRRGSSIPYGMLSPGERAIRAIEVVVGSAGQQDDSVQIVALPQTIWESLDGDARRLVLQYAEDRQIAIVTAEASREEGQKEIRAEVLR